MLKRKITEYENMARQMSEYEMKLNSQNRDM